MVGYAAVAFYAPPPASGPAPEGYSKNEKKFLMDLAKKTVRQVVTTGKLPVVDEKTVPKELTAKKGCFVTLTKQGQLRGCIGHILPQEPLYLAVMSNARSAAIYDHRFPRVETGELGVLEFEVSILTEPKPLVFTSPEDLLNKYKLDADGILECISEVIKAEFEVDENWDDED